MCGNYRMRCPFHGPLKRGGDLCLNPSLCCIQAIFVSGVQAPRPAGSLGSQDATVLRNKVTLARQGYGGWR